MVKLHAHMPPSRSVVQEGREYLQRNWAAIAEFLLLTSLACIP